MFLYRPIDTSTKIIKRYKFILANGKFGAAIHIFELYEETLQKKKQKLPHGNLANCVLDR